MRRILTLSGRKLRDDEKEPSPNSMGMWGALQLKQVNLRSQTATPIYGGTVPFNVIKKRRAKSKMAKQTRKANRGK